MLLAFMNGQLLGQSLLVVFAMIGLITCVVLILLFLGVDSWLSPPLEGRSRDEPPEREQPDAVANPRPAWDDTYEAYAAPGQADAPLDFVPRPIEKPTRFYFDVYMDNNKARSNARYNRLFAYTPGDLAPLLRYVIAVEDEDGMLYYIGPRIHELDCGKEGLIVVKIRDEERQLVPMGGRLNLIQWDHANLCWYWVMSCICFSGYAPGSLELRKRKGEDDDGGADRAEEVPGSLQAGDL